MKLRSTLSILGLSVLSLPAFAQASVTQPVNIGARILKPLVITGGGNGNVGAAAFYMEFGTIALNDAGAGATSSATVRLDPANPATRSVTAGTAFLVAGTGGPLVAANPQASGFQVTGTPSRVVSVKIGAISATVARLVGPITMVVNNFQAKWDGGAPFAMTVAGVPQTIIAGGTSTMLIGGDLVIPAGVAGSPIDGDYIASNGGGTQLSVTVAYN